MAWLASDLPAPARQELAQRGVSAEQARVGRSKAVLSAVAQDLQKVMYQRRCIGNVIFCQCSILVEGNSVQDL